MSGAPSGVAAKQVQVADRFLDLLHEPVSGDTYIRGVLPAPEGEPTVRVVTGKSPTGLEDASLWQIPLPAESDEVGDRVLGVVLGLFSKPTILVPGSSLSFVMDLPMIDVDPQEVEPAESALRLQTLPLLHQLTACPSSGLPETTLRGFWLIGDTTVRLYVQPFGRPPESGPVAVDAPWEADPADVERAAADASRYTPLLGDLHCTAYVDLARS
ncbi:hypothetical protein DC60_02800 [Streptomyces wadayamensis]|uniref:Uncharacterized protein n=1 Tax=Streptomyces wadayamensis TaxID=141454 RepID=A0ABR4S5Q9_9ACTN|nr:hypothetical protein DC60_02800 [Streptomyces wadayamensis]